VGWHTDKQRADVRQRQSADWQTDRQRAVGGQIDRGRVGRLIGRGQIGRYIDRGQAGRQRPDFDRYIEEDLVDR
jgi:hypothetical protein